MAENWHIGRRSRSCALTGAPIDPALPFFSALLETDEGFERRDYAAESWPEVAKDDFFSYWKNKGGGATGAKRPQVDYDRLLAFFDSLEKRDEPRYRLFRYVLALMLVRRRLLRLDDMGRSDEGDRLVVFDKRDSRTLEITAPEATKEAMDRVQDQLNRLFDDDEEGEAGTAE